MQVRKGRTPKVTHRWAGLAMVGGLALAGGLAAPASAQTLSLSATPTTPVEQTAFTVRAVGTTPSAPPPGFNGYVVALRYKPQAAGPCGPGFRDDPGTSVGQTINLPAGQPFDLTYNATIADPGAYRLCGWIMEDVNPGSGTSLTATPVDFAVRAAHASLSLGVAPNPLAVGQPATVTAAFSAEIALRAYARIKPAGSAPCGATVAADWGGQTVFSERAALGDGTAAAVIGGRAAGSYLVCAWLQKSGTATTAAAGPVSTVVTVGAPAPPPPPPSSSPVGDPAKLTVARARVAGRRLDVLAHITRRATGSVRVRFTAAGRTTSFSAPIVNGTIRIKRPLSAAQRRKTTGIVELSYAGSATVRPDSVRLRAASGRALLRRQTAEIRGGRLRVSGTISRRARGVVRIRLEYVDAAGTLFAPTYSAPIRAGVWKLDQVLPAGAAGGGQLSIQYTGYEPRRIRGEQDAKQVRPS